MKNLLWLALLAVCLAVAGGRTLQEVPRGVSTHVSNNENFQILNPATMPKPVGYSQMAMVKGGTVVFISGQVALDKSGNVVGKDEFRLQVEQVFENLKAAVEAAGGTFNDVIKLNSYFTDFSHLSEFRQARDRYVNPANPPASTAIQVQKLVRPEFMIEVEAVAVIQKK